MRQILQNLSSGDTCLVEVNVPQSRELVVETTKSLVSLGTEKMLVDFGKGNLLAKARSQPDKVKQVLQKVKTDGLWTTIDAVKAKLDTPIPLGYCNVGSVVTAGTASGYKAGDRIASNGLHAEIVSVPKNLSARIPDEVSDEHAAFTVVGAIGLQGIRLLNPTLGEKVVVSGLGLIGLLAVQMLRANGCQVLGIDFDESKLALAEQFGARTVNLGAGEDPIRAAEHWTNGVGVDGVLITASTKSDELIHQAATMCRKRGRIVLVGVIGLNLQRADFYEKELSFQVSCSYGPGRYDGNYEKKGLDYPIGHVRWTEKRNFEAVLDLLAQRKIDVEPLISHRFSFDEALRAYEAIHEQNAMGILLDYGPPQGIDGPKFGNASKDVAERNDAPSASQNSGHDLEPSQSIAWSLETMRKELREESGIKVVDGEVNVAFIGAGGFTTRMLLPNLPQAGVFRSQIASSTGVSAAHAANKYGFQATASSASEVLADPSVDAVFITTPHNSHARLVAEALDARKHVFVEKPLAMNREELTQVFEASNRNPECALMVGFNRRFSPHTQELKGWLKAVPAAKAVVITVNAGAIPGDHWTQDREIGGGRIIGEACHFIDLATYLSDSTLEQYSSTTMRGGDGRLGDCATLNLSFSDGSIASIHYLANGSKDFPKERVEVFAGGKVMLCENFRKSKEIGGKRKFSTRSQDKGHQAELRAFIEFLKSGKKPPISKSDLFDVSYATIKLAEQIERDLL